MRRAAPLIILAVLFFAVVAITAALGGFFVDWLWFDSLGFGAVFGTIWKAKTVAFAVAAVVSAAFLAINGLVAVRARAPKVRRLRVIRADGGGVPEVIEFHPDSLPWRSIVIAVAAFLALLIGLAQAGNWEVFLKALDAVPFGRTEPLFGRDLGFYVFTVPVLGVIRDWGLLIVFLAAAIAGAVYWVRGAVDRQGGVPQLSPGATRHLSLLLGLFFLAKTGDYLLQRYGLLLSNNGVVFGAAYTDIHVRLPLLSALAAMSVVAAVLCFVNIASAGFRLPVAAAVLVFGLAFIEGVVPALFQSYRVKPDELRLESPNIASNIALTRYAFGLDGIARKAFPAAGKLTPQVLAANEGTLENIRWWDPRPLLDTYRQLQELRLYYDFRDVDVDRYTFEGKLPAGDAVGARDRTRRACRRTRRRGSISTSSITHGIGLAMSPVNRFDEEGLPEFYIKDIPPVSSADLHDRPAGDLLRRGDQYLRRGPRRYARSSTTPAARRTSTPPTRATAACLSAACGGALLFAWQFGDVKLLISGNVTGDQPHPASAATSTTAFAPSRRSWRWTEIRIWSSSTGTWCGSRTPTPPATRAVLAAQPAGRNQLHPQLGEGRGRRLRRHAALLRRRPDRIRSSRPTSGYSRRCSSRSIRMPAALRLTSATRRTSSCCRRRCTAPTT